MGNDAIMEYLKSISIEAMEQGVRGCFPSNFQCLRLPSKSNIDLYEYGVLEIVAGDITHGLERTFYRWMQTIGRLACS